jgi:hypothetical protein
VKLFALCFCHRREQSIQLRLDYLCDAIHDFVNLGPFGSHWRFRITACECQYNANAAKHLRDARYDDSGSEGAWQAPHHSRGRREGDASLVSDFSPRLSKKQRSDLPAHSHAPRNGVIGVRSRNRAILIGLVTPGRSKNNQMVPRIHMICEVTKLA